MIEQDKITPEERARMKEEDNQVEAENQAFKEGGEKGRKEGKEWGFNNFQNLNVQTYQILKT